MSKNSAPVQGPHPQQIPTLKENTVGLQNGTGLDLGSNPDNPDPIVMFDTKYVDSTHRKIKHSTLMITLPLDVNNTSFFSPFDDNTHAHELQFGEIGFNSQNNFFRAQNASATSVTEMYTSVNGSGTGFLHLKIPITIDYKRDSIGIIDERVHASNGSGSK